jgi:hypothetical protein
MKNIQCDPPLTYNIETVKEFVLCATLPLRRAVVKRAKVSGYRGVGVVNTVWRCGLWRR